MFLVSLNIFLLKLCFPSYSNFTSNYRILTIVLTRENQDYNFYLYTEDLA